MRLETGGRRKNSFLEGPVPGVGRGAPGLFGGGAGKHPGGLPQGHRGGKRYDRAGHPPLPGRQRRRDPRRDPGPDDEREGKGGGPHPRGNPQARRRVLVRASVFGRENPHSPGGPGPGQGQGPGQH